jgi:hypothetical protein
MTGLLLDLQSAACPQLLLDLGRLLDYQHVCQQQGLARQHSGVVDSTASDISDAAAPGEDLEPWLDTSWHVEGEPFSHALQSSFHDSESASPSDGTSSATDDTAYSPTSPGAAAAVRPVEAARCAPAGWGT